jgi:hypothetical protein
VDVSGLLLISGTRSAQSAPKPRPRSLVTRASSSIDEQTALTHVSTCGLVGLDGPRNAEKLTMFGIRIVPSLGPPAIEINRMNICID